MKNMVMAVIVILGVLISNKVQAHQIYVKKNPTNENGIEFGVDDTLGFVRWRAYIRGVTDNSPGLNSGWTNSGNGWWYYDLGSVSQRVMWRLEGIANQEFVITYWLFRDNGSWEYGSQVTVVSDQVAPHAWFVNLFDGQVIEQRQFNLQILSSDNLNVVDKIRIYVIAPSGQDVPGWVPSGLVNQYYKEFQASYVDYDFTAPVPGTYTFTLWVKDQAGNINYEPGGPRYVEFRFSPELFPPAAPSNLQIIDEQNNFYLSWQDNASDEEGYLLYRNWQYLATLPANTNSYHDYNLAYGNNYCYRLIAFKDNLNSQAIETCIYLEELIIDYQYADNFVYPMDCTRIYRLESDDQIPVGACYDYQPFGSLFAYVDKVHLGADLNLKSQNDLGEPVYAIANALIWDFGWTAGWGNYLILQITAQPGQNFWLSNGNQVSQVYALYAHLDTIFIQDEQGNIITSGQIVSQQTYVKQNWQIGTIGDANGNYSPHLHFEIRINDYDQLGFGYWPVNDNSFLNYFVDPIEFIDNNRANTDNSELRIFIHGYDRDLSKPVYLDLQQNVWQRQGRNHDGFPLASVGWANYIWLISSNNNQIATWDFQLPITGSWSVYAVVPRYYAQAQDVLYRVWHSSQDLAYPYELRIDQSNDDENQQVFLGRFDFYKTQRYSVDVFSQTTDYPAQLVSVDTLILVYEGEPGSGGGDFPTDNQVKIIDSAGTLYFNYQGTYSFPELHCSGGGLFWNDLILGEGLIENSVEVFYSDTIFCNIQFEDNSWLADWQGLLANHSLLVNNQKITAIAPNQFGGYNLVFNLVINEDDNNPTEQDDENYSDNRVVQNKSSAGSGGCHIGSAVPPFIGLINWLILLIPPFLIFILRYRAYKIF